MNLLNKNKSFEFFPALNFNLLKHNIHEDVSLLSCNMQIPSLQINTNVYAQRDREREKNLLTLQNKQNKQNKYKNKNNSIINNENNNLTNFVQLNEDLYFYTGLKQYYKVNIKSDILCDYYVEEKKNLLYLDKQTKERSSFLSGDSIFPIKKSYEFLKRRFILNLHTRDRLKTKESLVESFSDIVEDLNKTLLISLLFTSYKTNKLPSNLRLFFPMGQSFNKDGYMYHMVGISDMFVHKYSCRVPYGYTPDDVEKKHKMKSLGRNFIFLLKYLPNRQFYLMQYFMTNLNNKKVSYIVDNQNLLLLRTIIKEFMQIKFLLRFYFLKRLILLESAKIELDLADNLSSMLKLMVIMFNFVKKTYTKIFNYVFNLCVAQSAYIENNLITENVKIIKDSKVISISHVLSLNVSNLAKIYERNCSTYQITILQKAFRKRGVRLSFKKFLTGSLTRQFVADELFAKRKKGIRGFKFDKLRRQIPLYYSTDKTLFEPFKLNFSQTPLRDSMFIRRYELTTSFNPAFLHEAPSFQPVNDDNEK